MWASLEVGVHILVSWDPFFYDFKAYARISAGIDIEVCFFVCGRVRMSFSFSAEVHIHGPKLRGSVKLDLDLTSVTIKFGPSGSTNSANPLSFAAFHDKYLRSGDDGGTCWRRRSPRVRSRRRPRRPDRAPARGSRARPTTARPAGRGRSRRSSRSSCRPAPPPTPVTGVVVPPNVTGRQLDLGPAHRTNVVSRLVVTVVGTGDITAAFDRALVLGKVPEATWTKLPSKIEPGAAVVDSVVGLTLVARVDLAPGSITVEIERIEISKDVKPLPFGAEQRAAAPSRVLGSLRDLGGRVTEGALGVDGRVRHDGSPDVGCPRRRPARRGNAA